MELNHTMSQEKINTLAKKLEEGEEIEFVYNDTYYEISESCEGGYMVDLYSSYEKDEYGQYLEQNSIDGGHCTGSAKDAVEFML